MSSSPTGPVGYHCREACRTRRGADCAYSSSRGNVEACLELTLGSTEPVVEGASGDVPDLCPQRTLPDDRHSPTAFQQLVPCMAVTLDVVPKLGLPELTSGGRMGRTQTTGMAMPETAVNEAGRPEAGKDEIRCSGKAANMKPISETTSVERSPQGQLGLRIPDGDARHDARAGRLIHRIGHRASLHLLPEHGLYGTRPPRAR